jgi:hypothetical protein
MRDAPLDRIEVFKPHVQLSIHISRVWHKQVELEFS